MNNTQENQYIPNYLVTPGEVLEEYLEEISMPQKDLAGRIGLAIKTINEIVHGNAAITPETAGKLEYVFGPPAHFWNNLEIKYQEDKVRLKEREQLKFFTTWLELFPVKEMIKYNWIPEMDDIGSQVREMLRFFGVVSPDKWNEVFKTDQIAYRQTQGKQICIEAVLAWNRRGVIEAQKLKCEPFDAAKFKKVLLEIRTLTTMDPKEFQPALIKLCASAGVVVIFVPELPKTWICGATYWIGDKAVIQLSLLYKTNDHLWFTFFHEAGHILKHGRKDKFFDYKKSEVNEKEDEANTFACDTLIPRAKWNLFLQSGGKSKENITRFSEEVGIAPGIVVGRLQHEKKLVWQSTLNSLKVHYKWASTG